MLMMLMMALSVWAQLRPGEKMVNGWFIREFKADALLGTKAGTQYFYSDNDLTVGIYPDNNLTTLGGDYVVFNADRKGYVEGVIGLYDTKGKLLEKYSTLLSVSNGKYSKGSLSTTATVFAFEYLRDKKGFVRYVFETWGESQAFDLMVPCLNNE